MTPSTARKPRRGATAVETAVVMMPLLMLLFGILEFGRFVMHRNLLDNSVREGARFATVNTERATTEDVQARVTDFLGGQRGAFGNLTITVEAIDQVGAWQSAKFGERVAVEASADYAPLVPTFGILPRTIRLRARAVMSSESTAEGRP